MLAFVLFVWLVYGKFFIVVVWTTEHCPEILMMSSLLQRCVCILSSEVVVAEQHRASVLLPLPYRMESAEMVSGARSVQVVRARR